MIILPLRLDLQKYLHKHNLEKKFSKQKKLFENNPAHPSLNTELLEPKRLKIYSFRLDKKYRAIFIYTGQNFVEIIDINPHYT
ncbi:MAG: hypothetical protein ABH896_00435 [Candidatus Jacksonbacteria bacterium]